MNAKDLMIGDWVIRRGVHEETMLIYDMKASAGIVYLDQDGRGVAEKFENIEPIPLTEEILMKNGFKKVEKDLFHLGQSSIGVDTWLSIDNNVIYVDALYHDGEIAFCKCEYIHELQHALKLCKIEKEIVL